METTSVSTVKKDIIVTDDVYSAVSEEYRDCYLHIFIIKESIIFKVGDSSYDCQGQDGIILIEGKKVEILGISEDATARILILSRRYIHLNSPKITFNIRGLRFYFDNPIMRMSQDQLALCLQDVENIRKRMDQSDHLYHHEVLRRVIDVFTYDIFDIYTSCNNEQHSKGGQEALVTQEFINLLRSNVRKQRTVAFYAQELCVTPKYLSRVCLQSTGHNASYWIGQFAVSEMLEELSKSSLTLTEISIRFQFQSLSHFTRFIKQHTGMTPSEFRMKKRI